MAVYVEDWNNKDLSNTRNAAYLLRVQSPTNTGHFIMFCMITNIYNKKTEGPTLMELLRATGKLNKFFFWQLEMFDVWTTGDMAHIDTVFQFLPHLSTWVHRYSSLLQWSMPKGTDHCSSALQVTRHTSIWYSGSCHTCVNIPLGMDHCSSEEYWYTHVDKCVAGT
jgi:hypothetical protein